MVYIPHDIWVNVAEFLPDSVLRRLLAVNSTLHHIALDRRYREVTVRDLVGGRTAIRLRRLRDPYVANRVHSLNIFLEENQDYFLNWEYYRHGKNWWRPLIDIRSKGPQTALDGVIQMLVKLVLGLPNVTALRVCALEAQLSTHSGPIFAAAWKTFGANLRRISLEGYIYHLPDPLSIPNFTRLRELQLKFVDVSLGIDSVMCNVLTPIFNRLAPVLESLSLSFETKSADLGHLDVTDFFDHFDSLPRLKTLILRMPLLNSSNHVFLKRLLCAHAATLRHVTLKLGDSMGAQNVVAEGHLFNVMTDLLDDNSSFVNLESFEFSPTIQRVFQITTMCLARSADTLTSLTLADRYLTYQEVDMLTSVFFHRAASLCLRTLVINVQFFSPRLLILLATSFSGLKLLDLRGFDWGVENSVPRNPGINQRLEGFRKGMKRHTAMFANWGVRDVAVKLGEMREPPDWPRFISRFVVDMLAECIPNAHCSWGVEEKSVLTF